LKPIILVFGLSGVGKTYAAKAIRREFSFEHLDIDRNRGFASAGFPSEWDSDVECVDFADLAAAVRGRLGDQYRGVILSFPTTYRFTREQLCTASSLGIGVVILWGTVKQCWDVRRERQRKNKGTTPSHADYLRKNEPTFDLYKAAGCDEFRLEAFQADGSRPSRGILLARIRERLANQGIDLTAS